MKIASLISTLHAFKSEKRLQFTNREDLECYQQKRLTEFAKKVANTSPYFSQFSGLTIEHWPAMNKASMLQHFDTMNTAKLNLTDVFSLAMQAEKTRDFSARVGKFTVGLSSGTSGQRGVFAVSQVETACWAGVILAKMLPSSFALKHLVKQEKVAFFLRANSYLYQSIRSPWLRFCFFDLFSPMSEHIHQLQVLQPTVLIAPAQVLRYLAIKKQAGELAIAPKKIISVAEVLSDEDKHFIQQAFFQDVLQPVHQIYQATEGLLATTCALGNLHLNETHLHIQPHWLDVDKKRFNPIITDFTRTTQPIINYFLNDVLVIADQACTCGQVSRTIAHIEGRNDDVLLLPNLTGGRMPIFSDMLTRAFSRSLPFTADYQLVQSSENTLSLSANISQYELAEVSAKLVGDLKVLGVDVALLHWQLSAQLPITDFTTKKRRIINLVKANPNL